MSGAQNSLSLAINVLAALPALVTAGEETIQLINSTVATLKVMQTQGRDPLPSEWAAIEAQLDALTDELDAPEGSDPADAPVDPDPEPLAPIEPAPVDPEPLAPAEPAAPEAPAA